MISKRIIKQILLDNRQLVESFKIVHRDVLDHLPCTDDNPLGCKVFVGLRRAGKSFVLFEKMQQLLQSGHGWDEMLYLSFEDERLEGIDASDLNALLECHIEMGGSERPMFFLDEVQNVAGWEKYARRMADAKHQMWITGSNAKMLSSEILTTLGGRFQSVEVYPYSFGEFLRAKGIAIPGIEDMSTTQRASLIREFGEYFAWGGLPEGVGHPARRSYLSSVYQKIYLGDICARNRISNPNLLRLMLKKVAESIKQPISYSRIAKILSSVGGKVSVPTISSYIGYCEESWMMLRLRNICAAFAERETNSKYYFVDNGLVNLVLIDPETTLLENLVAVSLLRRYGHGADNERVFFYHQNVEVDFYIPDEQLAIQVAFSVESDPDTLSREVSALTKLPQALPCQRRVIITYDEETAIDDEHGQIEVLPCWKWLLHNC